jgi:hypothetical protein
MNERRWQMNAIKATWTKGQIVPSEPVDWPEGSELVVEPVPPREKIGMSEEDWRDDSESIAAWIAAVEMIEPMIWKEGEEEDYERYRKESREFNIEAVRKQMETMPAGDVP